MSYHRNIGRVHWLLWHLPKSFCVKHRIMYNYAYHNYTFLRYRRRTLRSVFIVVQTSRHYWQCTYVNLETQHYEHFGYRNTKRIAEKMVELSSEEDDTDIYS